MSSLRNAATAILIVEDDEATAELEKRAVLQAGRRIRIVSRVTEALEALKSDRYLAILLDHRLADGESWAVLDAAQQAVPRVPVILVTAAGDERVAAEAIHRGGADYLIKSAGFWEKLPGILDRVLRLTHAERTNEQLAAVVASSEDAILSTALDGVILTWNPGAEELFGYTAEEAIGGSAEILIPPDRRGEQQTIAESVLRGETLHLETVRVRKDGSRLDVSTTVSPIRDKGKVVGAATISRDIGDRKRSEEALRASEERYRLLFQSNPQPMWVFDNETLAFLAVNAAACTHYGYTPEEFLAMTIRDIRPPGDAEALLDMLVTEAREYRRGELWKHRKKDGTVIDVQIDSHPLTFDGRAAQLVLALDITEKRRLEEQLRQSQKMEAIGQLAGGVAHDFNNLLTVIQGHSELLKSSPEVRGTLQTSVEEIQRAGERAASLTSQLLAFSRKQVLQPKVLDLNFIVSDMERMLRRLIGDHIRLVSNLRKDLGRVRADPNQIEQVVLNLALNARDAMPGGGTLTIETANADLAESYGTGHANVRPGRHVLLAVSDSGIGMDAETRSHIFEPFFTTKGPGKGTGLGLATTHGIVKQSDGIIWVYSEPGKGTTFKIYLPRVDDAVDPALPELASLSPVGSETLLLVEDEDSVRSLARAVLERQGYAVLAASSGIEALEIASRHGGAITLLITDAVMPGMSGRELSERLRQAHSEIRVLVMSGYTDDAIVHNGVLGAGVAFLQKPFTPGSLVRKVREVLDASA